jgi:lipoate-protein ligase A
MKNEEHESSVTKSVYRSDRVDPAENLGFEDYLMKLCEEDEVILYLWQNRKTIVIGKHQNPYKECDLAKLERDHIHLVRRKTGGGFF